jgi:transcriptional regulator with XRE-family HTH domain
MHINSVNREGTIQQMESIAQRIKALRVGRGLNQTELAEAVGVRQSTISDIERGANFEASTLMALSKVLLKSPQFIMTGQPEANELSEEEANVITALRSAAAKKAAAERTIKKTELAGAKAVSSTMSTTKSTKKRGAA